MRLPRHADLVGALALAGAGAVTVEHVASSSVRLAFVLPMLFVLPGYTLVAAFFGLQEPEPALRAALTLGLSLTVSVLGALALNLSSYGLRAHAWSLLIVCVVVVACAVAALRRMQSQTAASKSAPRRIRMRSRDVILVVLALGVAVGALVFASTPLPAKNVQGFTALSMLPSSRGKPHVDVEIVSAELRSANYRLEVRVGAHRIFVAPRIELAPGADWRRMVVVATSPLRRAVIVDATLTRTDHGEKRYRTVRVYLRPLPNHG